MTIGFISSLSPAVFQQGTTAIQLAHQMGAKVIATAGSEDKCQACRDLGADLAINYRDQDFVEAAKEFTGGKGADVILDMVGLFADFTARFVKQCPDWGAFMRDVASAYAEDVWSGSFPIFERSSG